MDHLFKFQDQKLAFSLSESFRFSNVLFLIFQDSEWTELIMQNVEMHSNEGNIILFLIFLCPASNVNNSVLQLCPEKIDYAVLREDRHWSSRLQ